MAIKKIIKVENLGRFTKLAAEGKVEFQKLNLIWGPNGSGKTTLASVLRSLKTGDPVHLQERTMLGGSKSPEVEILLSNGKAVFKNGQWTQTAPNIEIFDSTYVSENVYTGEYVDSGHRKNLYDVVVGAPAVALAREIDRLDSESRSATKKISDLEKALDGHIQKPFQLDAFLKLPTPTADLDEKIAEQTNKLNALRQSQQILKRPELVPLKIPAVPQRVLDALSGGGEKVSAQAEQRVREHLQTRLGGAAGEPWLAKGLSYLHDATCPFCAQDTSSVDLIPLFRQFFSDAYREAAISVQQALNDLSSVFGEESFSRLQKTVLENENRISRWSDLVDINAAAYSTNLLESRWRNLRELLRARLEARLANPAATDDLASRRLAALKDWSDTQVEVDAANDRIVKANIDIANIKKQSASADEGEVEAKLRQLRNTQIRHKPAVAELCAGLVSARAEKKKAEDDKKTKRASLEAMAGGVLQKYESAINELLKRFGATFSLTDTKPSFQGGKASSIYQLEINQQKIPLGDASTRGTPCFRTALSTGDKSTLALAFFIATLESDPELATKTLVFDDPLTSLDAFRCNATEHQIRELAKKAEQVVVLSHDYLFVSRLFDKRHQLPTLVAEVAEGNSAYVFREFDVQAYCRDSTHHDYFELRKFLDAPKSDHEYLRSVHRAIRPYLEGQLRQRFPDEFLPNTWLGDFVQAIRNASSGPLLKLQSKISDFEEVKDYSNSSHHAGNVANPSVPIAAELRNFVERAIALGQGV